MIRKRLLKEFAMKYLQRLGKSLMLPVSIMPIAALLKGIGYWIDPTGTQLLLYSLLLVEQL